MVVVDEIVTKSKMTGAQVFPLILEGLSTLCTYPEDSEYVLQLLLSLSSFLVDESNGMFTHSKSS